MLESDVAFTYAPQALTVLGVGRSRAVTVSLAPCFVEEVSQERHFSVRLSRERRWRWERVSATELTLWADFRRVASPVDSRT